MRTKWFFNGISLSALVALLLVCASSVAQDVQQNSAGDADPEAGPQVEPNAEQTRVVGQSGLQGRPKWEFGVGGGFFEGFDYPGSLDSNRRQFGLPFFIYRSKRFRFGGGGLSAVTIEKPRFRVDWSVAASLNASTQENSVREGLPDLDFLLELGPQLIWRAVDTTLNDGTQIRLDWSTKLRGVVSTDFGSVAGQGFVFETTVSGRLRNFLDQRRVVLFGALSARAGTEQLNDYFYEVDPQFSTATRPAFDARGGLIDLQATVGVGLNLPKRVRIFIATTTGFFAAAANRESPLHEALSTTSFALGVVWTIKQSKARVGVLETQ